MPHDRHFVKIWLPFEKKKISIIEVPLHLRRPQTTGTKNIKEFFSLDYKKY